MNSWRKGLSSLFLLTFVATGLWGCGHQALPDRLDDDRGGRIQSGPENPRVPDRLMKDASSNGITAANTVAQKINNMPGVQNTTVLVYGDDAFVGLTNISTETPKQDAQIKQDSWVGESPWGTTERPKSAAGMTVEQLQAEGIRSNAATLEGPRTTVSGDLSDTLKAEIIARVKQQLPNVKNVHVTGNLQVTQQLSGYKYFISRGGDMRPFMNDFLGVVGNSF